jgi:hypothetical protein
MVLHRSLRKPYCIARGGVIKGGKTYKNQRGDMELDSF